MTVPLVAGLTAVAAVQEPRGDYESMGRYDRYGFMYQQFMAEAYRRPD